MGDPTASRQAPREENPEKAFGATPKRKPQKLGGGGGGKGAKGAEAPGAETLRDGSRLCRNFSAGNCTRKGCTYKHQCSKVLNGGWVCSARHAAKDHL